MVALIPAPPIPHLTPLTTELASAQQAGKALFKATVRPKPLHQINLGETCTLAPINNNDLQMITTRFGLYEGAKLTVQAKVPGGAMVIRFGQAEWGLGQAICSQLMVY
ncbi:MAG: FeoA family protein [Vampirovibrionales bacterium]